MSSLAENAGDNPLLNLSERQMEILKSYDLLDDHKRVNARLLESLSSIEKMLQYAENKYNVSLEYSGYYLTSELEYLVAYQRGSDRFLNSFKIFKTDCGYKDNYLCIALRDVFSEYVKLELEKLIPNVKVKVFATISFCNFDEFPTSLNDYDGNIEGKTVVFTEGSQDGSFEYVAKRVSDFFENHRLYGVTRIVDLNPGDIHYPTKYNYSDFLAADFYRESKIIYTKRVS